jgi:hypothetical protein
VAITIAAVKAYLSFPSIKGVGPTDDEWTAWIASAAVRFSARTGITFDETVNEHYELYMSYIRQKKYEWDLEMLGGVTASGEGGSYVLRELASVKSYIDEMEKIVINREGTAPIAFGGDLIDNGYDDR